MALKIKVQPEDFVVEEIAPLPLKRKGEFVVYRLKKKGWNTVDVLREISRTRNIPERDIAYGGKKDRHGLTTQYITIRGKELDDFEGSGYSISQHGFMDRPMGPDLIEGNQFSVVVRKLDDPQAKKAVQEIESARLFGYPNYFDDQRFGSYDAVQGFIAEKILKEHYSGALKVYLTGIYSEDKKDEKERKQAIFNNWKDWNRCLELSKTDFEKEAFQTLQKDPKAFVPLLRKISREDLSLFISTYQSFIWNEVVRRLIHTEVPMGFISYKGLAGDYIFYSQLNQPNQRHFFQLKIPTLSSKFEVSDLATSRIYNEVLHEREIKRALFNRIQLRQAYFKSTDRDMIMRPKNIHASIAADHLYPGKTQLTLNFFLPRGSYATMLIKRLFSTVHHVS